MRHRANAYTDVEVGCCFLQGVEGLLSNVAGAGLRLAKGIDDPLSGKLRPLDRSTPSSRATEAASLLQFEPVVVFGGDVSLPVTLYDVIPRHPTSFDR
jgi:hypothetical protein